MSAFFVHYQTIIALVAAWLFSAVCSSMPPLRPDAGYYATWSHNLLQYLAANMNKIKTKTE